MEKSTCQSTPLVKKTTAILFIIYFVMFSYFKPFEHSGQAVKSSDQLIFTLYNFIVNQTLGIVHEAGHGVCYILPCPEFFMVLNGTLFQWLFPFLVGYYYKKRGQMLGYFIGLFFLGMSMHYTAWYISTAHEGLYLSAAKSFLGIDGYHDFYYILSTFGLLKYDGLIAALTQIAANLVMLYSVIRMYFLAFISPSSQKKNTRWLR